MNTVKLVRVSLRVLAALVGSLMLTGCMLNSLVSNLMEHESTDDATPTFAVVLSSAAASPHDSSAISVTVNFSGVAVTGLTAGDFIVTNGSASNLVDTGGASSFTLDVTPSGTGTYTMSVRLPASVAQNSSGHNNAASNTLSFTIDESGPTALITGPVLTQGTSATSFVYTVTYTDATTVNLTNGDISLGGSDSAGCSANVTNGTTSTATVTITGCTGDGTVNFSVAANTAEDAYANQAAAFGPSSNATVKNSFIITFKTDNTDGSSTGATTASIPLVDWIGYDMTVQWDSNPSNDSTVSGSGSGRVLSHNYSAPGTYDVKITGTNIPQFKFCSGTDQLKIVDVKQWGKNSWWKMEFMFENCKNIQISATDAPNLTVLHSTGFKAMFQYAENFNSDISHWNTSTVADMSNMFLGASSFNKPLNSWNTSNVTTMRTMFAGAAAFNQNISSWSTLNVTDMGMMFLGATAYNQPMARSGNTWNTSNVTSMWGMFEDASAFNQDIGNWIFSPGLTEMDQMFKSATVFNQDLSSWSLPSGVTNQYFDQGANAWTNGAWKPTFPP